MEGSSRHTIYTIGHSTRSLGEFIAMLRSFGIRNLVDIRSLPGSGKFPQFNRENLESALPANGINYLYLKELGGRRKVRADSRNTRWKNLSFRGYADYMETEAFAKAAAELEKIALQAPTATMCAEAVWWRCHRSMVSDYLKARGWKVLHITDIGKAQEHPYTSPAQIAEGRVSYQDKTESLNHAAMGQKFKIGDHVRWNSEAGMVSGRIIRVHTSDFDYKGYTHHASEEEPQYEIQSDQSDHIAAHKGSALSKI